MFHRGFHFGRLVMLMVLLFGAMAIGRGIYRSGFEDGFMRGMTFTAGGEAPVDPTGEGVTAAPAYAARAPWRGQLGPVEGGFLRFGFLGIALLGFGGLAFMAMLFMTTARRHHWAHHGPSGPHGRHGPWGHHGHQTPGPEKQPEDYV